MIALRTLRHNIEIGPGEKGLVPEAVVMAVPKWCWKILDNCWAPCARPLGPLGCCTPWGLTLKYVEIIWGVDQNARELWIRRNEMVPGPMKCAMNVPSSCMLVGISPWFCFTLFLSFAGFLPHQSIFFLIFTKLHHVAMLHALAWGEAGLRLAAAHVKGLAMHATGLHLRATLATFAAGRDVEAGELQGFPEAISQFEAGGPGHRRCEKKTGVHTFHSEVHWCVFRS